MAKQNINVGTAANDKKGDSLRAAFQKVNANFTELYTELGLVNDVTLSLGAFEFAGSTLSTTDSTAIVIDQATTVTSNLSVGGDILPQTANGGDLGSSTLPWRSLYVSNNTIYIGGTALSVNGAGNLLVNGSLITGGGSGSSLVNGAKTVSLGSDGNLTLPTQGKIMPVGDVNSFLTFNYGDDVELKAGDNLYLSGSVATIRTNGNANQWIFGTDGTLTAPGTITASNLIVDAGNISFLGNGSGIQGAMSFNLSTNNFTNNWNFSQDGTLSLPNNGSLTFPDGTTQTTAWTGFSVAADDSTQRLINADEVVKFIGAGGITTASDAEGNITITGTIASSLINGAHTLSLGSTGILTLPEGSTIDESLEIVTVTLNQFTDAGLPGTRVFNKVSDTLYELSPSGAFYTRMELIGGIWRLRVSSSTYYDSTDLITWGTVAGSLPTPVGTLTTVVTTNLAVGSSVWGFGEDGNLTLPAGGNISEGGGISGAIKLTPAGGANANQALLIYPTAGGEGDHIHLTAGGGSTELYLGDDLHFVKLTSDGFVAIKAYDGVNGAVWGFSPDGTTSIPGDIKSDSNINIEINLSDSTLRRWQFGEDGDTVFPNNVSINYSGGNIQFPRIIADSGKAFSVQGQGTSGSAALSWTVDPDAAGQYAAVAVTRAGDNLAKVVLQAQSDSGDAGTVKLWKFDETGALTIPGDIKSNGNINIDINLADSTLRRWHFGEDGELTVPGPISGLGNAKLDFTTYANVAYLTSTSDDSTALYMGSVSAELYAHTDIIIRTNTGGTAKVWNFNPDGSLTLPGSITLTNGAVIKDTAGDAVAFGAQAGFTSQSIGAVAVGAGAGNIQQGINTVAVGYAAGQTTQGANAVAVGSSAGNVQQGTNAVAIGREAGNIEQGAGSVAIGYYAGGGYQGVNSVAIGYAAGYNGQAANSIVINATGSVLNQATPNTFTVAPIRNISATSGVLQYNASTKEVSYSNSVTAETFNTDQITVVGNRISTTVTNANLEIECNGSGGVVINTLAEATTASTARSAGYLGIPASAVSTTNTLTIADAGEHIYVTTNGQTITIPANASVAYPIGTTLTFIAGPSPVVTVTIAITSDTLRLAGGTSTGTRTLAANGMATAVKVAATTWYINGTGLT